MGGLLANYVGQFAVFAFGAVLTSIWLWLAISMRTPPAVKTKMYHLEGIDEARARQLARQLAAVSGVAEAVVSAEEGVAYLKVSMTGWDEDRVLELIEGGA